MAFRRFWLIRTAAVSTLLQTDQRPLIPTNRWIPVQRSAADVEKLKTADFCRRRIQAIWSQTHSKPDATDVDRRFRKPLTDLLAIRPLGSRYRADLISVQPVVEMDDMPAATVGQLGVVAIQRIDAGTLLGIYEGRLLKISDIDRTGTAADYYMDGSLPFRPRVDDPRLSRSTVDFTIDPSHPYGNGVMERINDYRLDVLVPNNTAANPVDRCNVAAQQLFTDVGDAWTCIISTQVIAAGKPLLMDYGNGYWLAKHRRSLSIVRKRKICTEINDDDDDDDDDATVFGLRKPA